MTTNVGSSLKTNIIKLVSGNGATSLITLIAMPIITRYYPPEAFGMAALFASIIGIVGVVACLRYEMAIILPDNETEANNLLALSLSFAFLTALLTIPLIWLFGSALANALNTPDLLPYLWLVPLAVLMHGSFTALNYWHTRHKNFSLIAMSQIFGQSTNTGGVLSAGFIGMANGGSMILAAIGGKMISVILFALNIRNTKETVKSVSLSAMIEGLKRHKKFPLYGSWSILLGVGAWQLPILLMGSFFTSAIVGFYALGFRVLQMPMNLIGSAVGQVFFQSANEAKNNGNLPRLVDDMFEKLVAISLFPLLMLMIIGRDLYVVVFGDNWAQAGIYTQILALWAFFWFMSGPFTTLFSVLEKQEMQLKWNVFNFSLRLGAILIGGYYESPLMAVSLLGASGVVLYGYKVFMTLQLADASIKKACMVIVKYTALFIPAGGLTLATIITTQPVLITLGVAVITSVLYGFYVLIKFFPNYKNDAFTLYKTMKKKNQ